MSDLITLGELSSYQSDVWQFPNQTNCPLRTCKLRFDTKEQAIDHYRSAHAKYTVLCQVCKQPLMLLHGEHHLKTHYQRLHPNHQVPQKVKEIWVNSLKRFIWYLFCQLRCVSNSTAN